MSAEAQRETAAPTQTLAPAQAVVNLPGMWRQLRMALAHPAAVALLVALCYASSLLISFHYQG